MGVCTPIVRVCNCSMFCCTLLNVHSSIAIILMGKKELVALLDLSSWCLVMVERLFLAVPWGCLRFVIVVFPDHTHLLFSIRTYMCLQGLSPFLEEQLEALTLSKTNFCFQKNTLHSLMSSTCW